MTGIEIQNLRKTFGELVAVDDVSLSVADGELFCLLGPSGCGKSTTLRMLGGLETPTSGSVHLDDEDVTHKAPYNRSTSMVFQSWALFPHKTVLQNVAFGPRMDGVEKDKAREQAERFLKMVEMVEFKDSKPTDLSGGQQQRIALARSLAMDPDALLLDEPLSNLDKRLREDMQIEVKRIHEDLEKTMVHVTHDQDEAFTLADRIGIMNDGRLVQVGEPREVYANPKNQFVEEFLGDTNFITTSVKQASDDELHVETASGHAFSIPIGRSTSVREESTVTVSLRPEVLTIEPTETADAKAMADGNGSTSLQGEVETTLYRGSHVRHYIDIGDQELFVEHEVDRGMAVNQGDVVTISWDADEVLCFDESERRVS